MSIKGGDKITMEANDIEFRGNSIRGNQIVGNMAPNPFTKGVFAGTKVGADKLSGAIEKFAKGGIPDELTSALESVDTGAITDQLGSAQEKFNSEFGSIADKFSGLGL